MRRLVSVLLALSAGTGALQAQVPDPSARDSRPTLRPASIRQPVVFERNAGQFPAAAAYVAQTGGGDVTFFADGRVAVGAEIVSLAGALPSKPSGVDRHSAQIRYFRGNDPGTWLTDVPAYRQVQLDNVYRGIDWVWRTTPHGQLEYDFVVRPGASPDPIALQFDRKATLQVSEGDLVVTRGTSRMVHRRPSAYQDVHGRRQSIDVAWRVAGARARLSIGAYDAGYPLVIDPLLVWSEYLTSSLGSGGTIAAAGPDGSVVVAGGSRVSRFTASGDLIFTSAFSGNISVMSAAVDAGGRIFLTGQTAPGPFPVLNAAQPVPGGGLDGFVVALAPDGNLAFSTYAGGSDEDEFVDIAIGPDGSLWLGGSTSSANFPSPGGFRNTLSPASLFRVTAPTGVIEHLTRDGQMIMASYLVAGCTTCPTGMWRASSVAVGSDGAVYVGALMEVLPFVDPIHGAVPDNTPILSALRISPADGSPLWLKRDFGYGSIRDLSVAPDGTVWAAGLAIAHEESTTTTGQLVPTADAYDGTCGTDGRCDGKSDGFLLALDGMGNTLYATYLGGADYDSVSSLRVSPQGFVWLTGRTASSDWPDVKAGGTDGDAFVMRFAAATRTLNYVTRLGGGAQDGGTGIAPDPQGGAFLAGSTASADLPARRNALGDATTFLAYFAPLTNVLTVDRPVEGATLFNNFDIAGWGLDDRSDLGSGFDAIHAWAFPTTPAGAPLFLGAAQMDVARPDVGAIFGSRYGSSGYGLDVSLPAGQYLIGVYARSAATGTFEVVRTVTVSVVDSTRITIDAPGNGATTASPFLVGGWAIDHAAPGTDGTGVDAVHVWAYPATGGPAMWVGAGEYGVDRPDVAAVYGARFRFSGYNVVGAALPPGRYTLVAFPHRAATGSFGSPVLTMIEIVGPS